MRFQLVDPSYCVTTDLTYHKHAIYEGVRSLYPNVSINVHRYYFEIEDESSQIVSDLPLINEEIAARDPYLKSLFKNHPVKTDNEIIRRKIRPAYNNGRQSKPCGMDKISVAVG